jgi:mevalonate kinase
MPAFTATAPGKIILFGEHAVVYGRPAIAVPVTKVKARVTVQADPLGEKGRVWLVAPDVGIQSFLVDMPESHYLAQSIAIFLDYYKLTHLPSCTIHIKSSIPVASGMGSGAAVSVAMYRALSAFLGRSTSNETISNLAYQMEKVYHGTPSGIDNTVIAYQQPVFFIKGETAQTFSVARTFMIVVGDTGISSPTANSVGYVRRGWLEMPAYYEELFDQIGQIATQARRIIEEGESSQLGMLMCDNHALLQKMKISSPELDRLVEAACQAGAAGAKLSGGGQGGNMIALVDEDSLHKVESALVLAGATSIITTEIGNG